MLTPASTSCNTSRSPGAVRRYLGFQSPKSEAGAGPRKLAFSDRYSLEAAVTIGEGFNGRVVQATNLVTNERVAVKVLADHPQSRQEIECQRAGGRSSVEIRDVFYEPAVDWKAALGSLPPNTNGQVIVVVMELMEGGELFYHIVQGQSKRLSEAEAREVAVQLAEALDDLHSAGVVHRDIKPENVLLAGTDELKLKLCDFGFASMGEPKGYECTVVYSAPELIRRILEGRKYSGSAPLTSAIDCWSLGVLLYLCLSGRFPFKCQDNVITPAFKRANLAGIISFNETHWAGVSNAAKSVVLGLLTVDPKTRLTAADVLKHPWVRDLAEARARAREATPNEAIRGMCLDSAEAHVAGDATEVERPMSNLQLDLEDANEEYHLAREAPSPLPTDAPHDPMLLEVGTTEVGLDGIGGGIP